MDEFTERILTVSGEPDRQLRVSTAGDGARLYVLVPGIGVSSRYFMPLARQLARSGTVHVLDLPGFGKTKEPSQPLSMADFAALVWQGLDRLQASRPLLIGHSMGAQVVVEMARQRPSAPVLLGLFAPTVNQRERSALQQGFRLLQDTFREPPSANAKVLGDYLRCGVRWYAQTLRRMLEHRIEERVGAITAPILILGGQRDPIAPAQWLQRLAGRCRTVRVRTVPGAHVFMYQGAALVADEVALALAAEAA